MDGRRDQCFIDGVNVVLEKAVVGLEGLVGSVTTSEGAVRVVGCESVCMGQGSRSDDGR